MDPSIVETKIGHWEEVTADDDFYSKYAVDPKLLEMTEPIIEDPEEVALENKLDNLEELDESQMKDLLNLDSVEYGKSLIKSKTDKLKKLIDSNFEIAQKPTFHKVSKLVF